MVRRVVLSGALGFFGGLFAAGILWWLNNQKRLNSIEQRLRTLENRVTEAESRILEFQSTYYEDKAEIEYWYSVLRREIEQLKLTSLNTERKEELDKWLDFLERAKAEKIQEAEQRPKEEPIPYVA